MTTRLYEAHQKYAYELGHDIGGTNNRVQAELLNGLSASLVGVCGSDLETQLYYVWKELSPSAKKVFTELAKFGEVE